MCIRDSYRIVPYEQLPKQFERLHFVLSTVEVMVDVKYGNKVMFNSF